MSESDEKLYTIELWDLDENNNPILYCFEEDELEVIKGMVMIPRTINTPREKDLNLDTLTLVGEDFDKQKCTKKEDYISNQAIHKDAEGYQEFTQTGFCAEGIKCKIAGIKMCIGIVVLHEKDRILCHYRTEDDNLSIEKYKLQEINNEMKERNWNWDNSTLKLYYRFNSFYLKAQNTSISIIANTLNISIGNIVLNIITDNYIKFN